LDPTTQLVAPSPAKQRKRRRLGKYLVKQGIVPKSTVRSALEEQERTGHRLGEILVARGAIDSATLVKALAKQDLVETVSAADRVAQALPISVAFEYRAVVLVDNGDTANRVTRVAVTDLATVPAIWEALGRPIEPKLTDPETMERLLSVAYPERRDGAPVEALPWDAEASVDASQDASENNGQGALREEEPAEEAAQGDIDAVIDPEPAPDLPDSLSQDQAEAAAITSRVDVAVARPAADTPEPASALAATTAVAESETVPASAREAAWAPPVAPAGAERPPAVPPAMPARRGGLRRLFGRQSVAPPPFPATAPRSSAVAERNGSAAAKSDSEPAADLPADPQLERELPLATVIVGLRQASPATLSRLTTLLEAIDYPRDRLQVLAVHDPADRVTRRALHDQPLPAWVTETVVSRAATPGPRGLLLCGLRAAIGDLVTVLSTSDPDEPSLLRTVAAGDDESPLVSGAALGPRALTNAFLRQAEPHTLKGDGSRETPRAATSGTVFCVAELREAFGWPVGVIAT
jgi:hypothetical protein